MNGKPMHLSEGITAAALLEQLKVQTERVVVEVNLNMLKRAQLTSTVLRAGDQVEIVHFVGGGALGMQNVEYGFRHAECGSNKFRGAKLI